MRITKSRTHGDQFEIKHTSNLQIHLDRNMEQMISQNYMATF